MKKSDFSILVGMPVFCPRCGIHLSDRDTDPDLAKRWLRCLMCGFCKPKIEKPQDE